MKRRYLARTGLFYITLLTAAVAQDTLPVEPEGFRQENFHAPTPLTLKGATVVDTDLAFELWKKKEVVFIDVLFRPKRPVDLAREVVWRAPPHRDIPDSFWLPDLGLGAPSAFELKWLENRLARATLNSKAKPLLIYCRTNCWASWNAAKRALSFGYKSVYWYPPGADAWEEAGHPVEAREAEQLD